MSGNFGGWSLAVVEGLGVHCVPVNDLHEHLDEDCPCNPIVDGYGLINHNSFDGREAFETGERKAS